MFLASDWCLLVEGRVGIDNDNNPTKASVTLTTLSCRVPLLQQPVQ
jgi:hypothetical protein